MVNDQRKIKMKTQRLAKITITMLALVMNVNVGAVDSSIYIDQTGSNATINVTQDGAGNRVRGIQGVGTSNTTPAVINGDNINVDISQVGANNVLSMGVRTTTAAGSNPTDITYNVSGGNNTGVINLNNAGTGTNESTTLSITQSGGGNSTNVNILGSKNSATVNQSGGSAIFNTTVNANETTQNIATSGGTNNSVTTNLTGNKGTVDVTMVGASNTATITQSGGAGVVGHNTTLDVLGSSNSYTINQSGTIDTTVNIKTNGSGNTFNVTTGN
jgi:hypothetical protein